MARGDGNYHAKLHEVPCRNIDAAAYEPSRSTRLLCLRKQTTRALAEHALGIEGSFTGEYGIGIGDPRVEPH